MFDEQTPAQLLSSRRRAPSNKGNARIRASGVDVGVNPAGERKIDRLFTGQGCLHLFKRVEIFLQAGDVILHLD